MTQSPQPSPSGQSSPPSSPPPGRRILHVLREIAETVLPALIIVLVLNLFFVQSTRVQMQSMEPTLYPGQLLVLEKVTYYFRPPQRGDIVVFRLNGDPNEHLIKRVIAVAGETIAINNGRVYIDGRLLDEPYVHGQPTLPDLPARTIQANSIFVMGDNRTLSNDSRSFGPVPTSDIIAKAWLRYWPPRQAGVLH